MQTLINKIYRICIMLLGFVWIESCSDDFLEIPTFDINSEAFYTTMTEAEQATTAAYGLFCKTTAWDRDVIMIFGDVTSDDAESGGDFENEVPDIEDFNRFVQLPTNTHLDDMYGILFRGIHFANIAIERIPNVLETDPSASAAIINQRIAEMKFIRAMNHLYLVHIFGEVPLVDHVLNPSDYDLGRATFKELFDFIQLDLTEAIAVLKNRSELGEEDIGRATKGAAQSMLARALLFESSFAHYYPGDSRFTGCEVKWSEVLTICENIIESGEYRLVGSTQDEVYSTWHSENTNGYRFMFTVEGDNNDESIFEIQYINDEAKYGVTRAGSLVQWTAPRYYSNESGLPAGTSYWGLGWPTQSLVDAFEPGDIRLNTAVSRPGDTIQVRGGEFWPVDFSNSGTGYYMNKYTCSTDQFADAAGHGWQKSPGNGKILRLGEVYLMAAEAAIMMSDNASATTYINAIRSRARTCGGGTVPADLTGTITIEQLMNERRVELAFEGRRFFDLVRCNKAVETLNGYTTPGGFVVNYTSPKHDFNPLPAREVTNSKGLEQLYGW